MEFCNFCKVPIWTTLKLGRLAFHSLKFQFSCLDFQSNQYKKLAPVPSRFCNGIWLLIFWAQLFGSYRVNSHHRRRLCALSVAMTFPFTACAVLATSQKCTIFTSLQRLQNDKVQSLKTVNSPPSLHPKDHLFQHYRRHVCGDIPKKIDNIAVVKFIWLE